MLQVQEAAIDQLHPWARNARTHSKRQVRKISDSITRFGFNNPVLVDDALNIIAGHGRVLAAQQLGMTSVPTILLSHMSETDKRAYVIADNQLATKAGWDREILATELQGLVDLGFEVELDGLRDRRGRPHDRGLAGSNHRRRGRRRDS